MNTFSNLLSLSFLLDFYTGTKDGYILLLLIFSDSTFDLPSDWIPVGWFFWSNLTLNSVSWFWFWSYVFQICDSWFVLLFQISDLLFGFLYDPICGVVLVLIFESILSAFLIPALLINLILWNCICYRFSSIWLRWWH